MGKVTKFTFPFYQAQKKVSKISQDVIKKQNEELFNDAYDDCNKQNSKGAVECFMNSINEELQKDVLAKIEDEMKVKEIFMVFIDNEQPQSGELHDTIEPRILSLEITKIIERRASLRKWERKPWKQYDSEREELK